MKERKGKLTAVWTGGSNEANKYIERIYPLTINNTLLYNYDFFGELVFDADKLANTRKQIEIL